MSYIVSKNGERWAFVWLCDGWVPRGGKLILSVACRLATTLHRARCGSPRGPP